MCPRRRIPHRVAALVLLAAATGLASTPCAAEVDLCPANLEQSSPCGTRDTAGDSGSAPPASLPSVTLGNPAQPRHRRQAPDRDRRRSSAAVASPSVATTTAAEPISTSDWVPAGVTSTRSHCSHRPGGGLEIVESSGPPRAVRARAGRHRSRPVPTAPRLRRPPCRGRRRARLAPSRRAHAALQGQLPRARRALGRDIGRAAFSVDVLPGPSPRARHRRGRARSPPRVRHRRAPRLRRCAGRSRWRITSPPSSCPTARRVVYGYEARGNLAEARFEDGTARTYHYENPLHPHQPDRSRRAHRRPLRHVDLRRARPGDLVRARRRRRTRHPRPRRAARSRRGGRRTRHDDDHRQPRGDERLYLAASSRERHFTPALGDRTGLRELPTDGTPLRLHRRRAPEDRDAA